jgi:hypothetical protein
LNFNSLIIGAADCAKATLMCRLAGHYAAVGQRVVYIGRKQEREQLLRLPEPDRARILFLHTPPTPAARINAAGRIVRLVAELAATTATGVAIFLQPASPEFAGLIHHWLALPGVTVHLAAATLADLAWLDLQDQMPRFQFQAVFPQSGGATLAGGTAVYLNRQDSADRSVAAIRFDAITRLVDVSHEVELEEATRSIKQLCLVLPLVLPAALLCQPQTFSLGMYPLSRLLGAVTRVYQDGVDPKLFLCYAWGDSRAAAMARAWDTEYQQEGHFQYVALPAPLSLWPFNRLGRVLHRHPLWWHNQIGLPLS